MEDFFVGIISSISSVSLIVLLAFLGRNWILEKLKASVKHQYDLKLESYKSQIVRREQAYEEVIGALYDMIRYFRVHKEDYGQGTGLPPNKERELLQKYISASSSLSKATDIGSLYISENAVKILQQLQRREQLDFCTEPKFEYFEQEYKEHEKSLNLLLSVAIQDLKRT